MTQYKVTNLRDSITGESFGYRYKVRILEKKRIHELHLYASRFEVTAMNTLVLFDKDGQPYRSFAPGSWQEIATISCFDGSEMFEEDDFLFEPVK